MRQPIQVVDTPKNLSGCSANCTHRGKPATKEAHFDEGKAMIIEKYCEVCTAA